MRPKTLLIDIDGCLLQHYGNLQEQYLHAPKLLPGVKEKFDDWDRKGYHIILLSGRRESMRAFTEKQLQEVGIFFDELILGVGGGVRVLINDLKPNGGDPTAVAVNLVRNAGVADVDI